MSFLLSLSALLARSWIDLPRLPSPISGQFAGVSHEALIVVGGSSFERPPYEGGVKQWHDTISVLQPDSSQWLTFHTAFAIGYGGSVTWRNRLIIAGGSNGQLNFRDVRAIEWNGHEPVLTTLPSLPVPLANCEAALVRDRMFVFGGQESPSSTAASNRLFSLDLTHPETGWQAFPFLPGIGRILSVFVAAGNDLYVFGGAALLSNGRRYLKDGWMWREGQGWKQQPEPPFALVAAPSISLSPETIIVFGGDDGELVTKVEELRERHPGFSQTVYEFNTGSRIWRAVGRIPLGLVTTTAVRWQNRVVIPGGEDRPGHRSERVLSWFP